MQLGYIGEHVISFPVQIILGQNHITHMYNNHNEKKKKFCECGSIVKKCEMLIKIAWGNLIANIKIEKRINGGLRDRLSGGL